METVHKAAVNTLLDYLRTGIIQERSAFKKKDTVLYHLLSFSHNSIHLKIFMFVHDLPEHISVHHIHTWCLRRTEVHWIAWNFC